MKSRFLIYSLVDPLNGETRYVGRSSSGLNRPFAHWKNRNMRERRDPVHNWTRSLLVKGLVPEIIVLQYVEGHHDVNDELNRLEVEWIAKFRKDGARLLNLSDGGGGLMNPPVWVREKMSLGQSRPEAPYSTRLRECVFCFGLFKGHTISRYCSHRCNALHRAELRRQNSTKFKTWSCRTCKREFKAFLNHGKEPSFCSRKCRYGKSK